MTWIVGAVSPFGHALLVSDVRVSFEGGTEGDLIQKAYCVGRYVVAGFSGSVRIGFHLMADLYEQLRLDDERMAWHPRGAAEAWSPRAAEIFQRFDDLERRAGCAILIAGVSPTENNGSSSFAKTYLMRLTAPTFSPTFTRQGMAALQIGSGSRVNTYKSLVRTYFRDPRFVASLGSWGADGLGRVLAFSLGREVAASPKPGISPHLHVVACSRGSLYQGTNDYSVVDHDRETPALKMPAIATS